MNAKRLKHLLHYCPDSGVFTWKNPTTLWQKSGDVAGTLHHSGYVYIRVDKKTYCAHRLAFLFMTNTFPSDQIDHINRIKSDNRWVNLRAATRSQNKMNSTMKNNTSGKKGVTWKKSTGKWQASIRVNGKDYHLGYYADIEDAAVAYKNIARILHGEFNCFGGE